MVKPFLPVVAHCRKVDPFGRHGVEWCQQQICGGAGNGFVVDDMCVKLNAAGWQRLRFQSASMDVERLLRIERLASLVGG